MSAFLSMPTVGIPLAVCQTVLPDQYLHLSFTAFTFYFLFQASASSSFAGLSIYYYCLLPLCISYGKKSASLFYYFSLVIKKTERTHRSPYGFA